MAGGVLGFDQGKGVLQPFYAKLAQTGDWSFLDAYNGYVSRVSALEETRNALKVKTFSKCFTSPTRRRFRVGLSRGGTARGRPVSSLRMYLLIIYL